MKKQLLKTALLATLPFVAIQADNNISKQNKLSIDPFSNEPVLQHFQKLHEEMNRVFEEFNQDFFNDMDIDPQFKTHFSNRLALSPKTDFVDKGTNYELKVDLPGMEESEIKVELKENLISIHAKSEQKNEEKKDNKIIKQERFVGMMSRTLTLPKDADPKKYTTNYKNGVLTVTIEKKK